MPEERNMTCIVCPTGCALKVKTAGGRIEEITGYGCKRGIDYATAECTNPVRTLTTTVSVKGGELPLVPVKSSKPIPKGMMMECMKAINSVEVNAPVRVGDIIIPDILGTGADIVATRNMA